MEENQDSIEAEAVFDIFFLDADGFECHLKLLGNQGVGLLVAGQEAARKILELGGRPRKRSALARSHKSRDEGALRQRPLPAR